MKYQPSNQLAFNHQRLFKCSFITNQRYNPHTNLIHQLPKDKSTYHNTKQNQHNNIRKLSIKSQNKSPNTQQWRPFHKHSPNHQQPSITINRHRIKSSNNNQKNIKLSFKPKNKDQQYKNHRNIRKNDKKNTINKQSNVQQPRIIRKHQRYNTQINNNRKQQTLQPINNSKINTISIGSTPNKYLQKQSSKIIQQCSLLYENQSEIKICLKVLQSTKQSTIHRQKYTFVSILDQQLSNNCNKSISIKQFNKQYKKGKLIGKGYFGEVYRGIHVPTGIICALKYLDIKRLIKQDILQSIKRQISCQMLLSHPNIVKLYQYLIDWEMGALVLVLEFVEGQQLYKIIKNKRRFNEEQTADIIYQVVEAVHHIHSKNIIHRDIKPENIMITNGIAKICDFGLSIITTTARKTLCGTPLYSSPEIVLGKQYDNKIDLWSIGILTYEMLVGYVPFKIYGEHQLLKIAEDEIIFPSYIELSSKAKDFINRLLNKNPQERMNIYEIREHPFIRRRKRLVERVSVTYPDFLQVLL